jgi:hypothetical protein
MVQVPARAIFHPSQAVVVIDKLLTGRVLLTLARATPAKKKRQNPKEIPTPNKQDRNGF